MERMCLVFRGNNIDSQLSTKQKGNATELECILAFTKRGYEVSIPYGNTGRYDFLADVDGQLLRVQCKTAHPLDDGNAISIPLRSSQSGNVSRYYSSEEIDLFATSYNGTCYLIPVGECMNEKRLRLEPITDSKGSTSSLASDYEIDTILHEIKIGNIMYS